MHRDLMLYLGNLRPIKDLSSYARCKLLKIWLWNLRWIQQVQKYTWGTWGVQLLWYFCELPAQVN